MSYRSSIDGTNVNFALESDYWHGSNEAFDIWNIDEAFIREGERYISGSFNARVFTARPDLFPRYRYVEGNFKYVRVTEILTLPN